MAKQVKGDTKELSTDEKLEALEKKYGLFAPDTNREFVSTGSHTLDLATRTGGYVLGTVVEIYGPESSGKSTVVLHALSQFQEKYPDRKAVLMDYEHSFDEVYATAIGVNVDKLIVYQPDNQEQGYDMILEMVEKNIASVVVIDSHTAAPPKVIVEGGMTDATMALQARLNSKFLLKIKGLLKKHGTTLIGISQLRENIGGMTAEGKSPTGGNAWKFYSDVRFKLWKALDKPNELNETHVDVIKNKCGKPFGVATFDIVWGEGIDTYGEIIDLAVEKKVIDKSGSWYSYGVVKLGQGREAVKLLFKNNSTLFDEIRAKTLEEVPKELVIQNVN